MSKPLESLVIFTLFTETWPPISGKNKMTGIETKGENFISMFFNGFGLLQICGFGCRRKLNIQ